MKSKKAEEYLHGTTDEKEFLEMTDLLPLHDAIKAVELAEQEAEEEIEDKRKKLAATLKFLQEGHKQQIETLKAQAIEAFKCVLDKNNFYNPNGYDYWDLTEQFIQKLNEK